MFPKRLSILLLVLSPNDIIFSFTVSFSIPVQFRLSSLLSKTPIFTACAADDAIACVFLPAQLALISAPTCEPLRGLASRSFPLSLPIGFKFLL